MEALFFAVFVGGLGWLVVTGISNSKRAEEENQASREREAEQQRQEAERQKRREEQQLKEERARERRERVAEEKFERQQAKRLKHNKDEPVRLFEEALDATNVRNFSVEPGRGNNHGGVDIRIEWKGHPKLTIEVAKSENPLRTNFDEIINLPKIGMVQGGQDTLLIQDREVQPNKNYHYYTWWKFETIIQGYPQDEDGVFAMEKTNMPFMTRVEPTLNVESIGVTQRERPIDLQKRRRDEMENELETRRVQAKLRGNTKKKRPPLEAVIAQELSNQKSQDTIYNRLMEVAEEQGMDEETRELFMQNVISKLGLDE